jgi:hypothetical protein
MARSLQIQPEEHVGTSPLLWGFLLFAALFLVAGAVATAAAEGDAAEAGEAR